MMIWLVAFVVLNGNVTFETVRTLEPPPEEKDLFLQNVLHIEIDAKGRFLASDYPSAHVYYWNADGSYAGFFGSQGKGPGEFSFAGSYSPPMGHVYAVDGMIYIYDSQPRTLSIFDQDYQFIRRINLEGLGGKINTFHVLEKDRFLFYDSYFCEDISCRRLLLYDGEGKLIDTWRTVPDKTWSMDESTGRTNLFIFAPTMAVDFDRKAGEVLVAFSETPVLDVYDRKGEKLRSVSLEIPKRPVLQSDIDEFHEQEWMKGPNSPKAFFPEERNYFDWVLSVKEGYLVYHLSPVENLAEGYLVDRRGKMKGRFELPCGDGGGLWSAEGRLFAALINDEDDFDLRELAIKIEP